METKEFFEPSQKNSYPHKKNENFNEKYKIMKKSGPFSYNCISYGENISFKLTFELIEENSKNAQESNENRIKQYIIITAIPYANKENYKDREAYIYGIKKSFTLNIYKEKFDYLDFRNICEKYRNLQEVNMIKVFNEMLKSIKENKSKIAINKFHLLFSYCVYEIADLNNIITLSLDNENEYNILECYEDANQKAIKTHNSFLDKDKVNKNQGKKLFESKIIRNTHSLSHSNSPNNQNSNNFRNNIDHYNKKNNNCINSNNNTESINLKNIQNNIPNSQDKNKNSHQNKKIINQAINNPEENKTNIDSNNKINNSLTFIVNKEDKIQKPRNKSMAYNQSKLEKKIFGKKEKKNILINQRGENNQKKERKLRNEKSKDKNGSFAQEKKISEEKKQSPSKEQKSKITKNFIYGEIYGENNFPRVSPIEDKNKSEKDDKSEKIGKKEEKENNSDKNKKKENDKEDEESDWGSSFYNDDFEGENTENSKENKEKEKEKKEEFKEKIEKEKENAEFNEKGKQVDIINKDKKEQFLTANIQKINEIQNDKEEGEIESDIEENKEENDDLNLLGHKHNIEKKSEEKNENNPSYQKNKKITPEKNNKKGNSIKPHKFNKFDDLNSTPVITIIESDDEGNNDNEYKNYNNQKFGNYVGKYWDSIRNSPIGYKNYSNNKNYSHYNKHYNNQQNISNAPAPINISNPNNNQRNIFQNTNKNFLRYFSEPSNIIHNMKELLLIKNKIEKSNDLYFKLVYSSLKDKDDYITFKNAVLDKYRHLILVQTTKGRRFAIYFNEKLFSLTGSQNLDKIDMMGFIFSFDKYIFYEPKERTICFTQSPSSIYLFRLSDYSIYIKNNYKCTLHHFGQSCKAFNIQNLSDEINGGEEEYYIDILEVYHAEIPQ